MDRTKQEAELSSIPEAEMEKTKMNEDFYRGQMQERELIVKALRRMAVNRFNPAYDRIADYIRKGEHVLDQEVIVGAEDDQC